MRHSADDEEDAWFSLLERLKAGMVVPVVGPGLLRPADAQDGGATLYHRIGAELAGPADTAPGTPAAICWPLFAGVDRCLARQPGSADRLRNKVARLVREATAGGKDAVPEPLHRLVSIDAFSLFVSLTCDDLLARALEAVDDKAYRRAFAVRTTGPELDIPAAPPRRGVYQLLGSADNPLDFAIHEGDALEYLYRLQSEHGRSVRLLLGELRKRDLLLIGCCLPDWLGRSLLRLASGEALVAKSTQDYVCDPGADPQLTTFLSLHSPKTLHFGGDAAGFVEELARRWQQVRPRSPALPSRPPAAPPGRSGATVFVSYASEDAAEARLLADRLLALGAADVWLDKRKLRGGDDWAERIEEAIARQCTYFMPVLSRRADARGEGVFWGEWKRALQRAENAADAFLLPTLIDDDTTNLPAGYQRIGRVHGTAEFLRRHLLRAPGGLPDDAACDELRALLDRLPA